MASKKFHQTLRWEEVKNTSGESCPAYGLLAITGSEMRGTTFKRPVLTGTKPSTTFYREYAVNGPTVIPAGGYGRCTRGPAALYIAYDSGTPANGEGWGPKPGQWTLSKGYPCTTTVSGIVDSTNKVLLGTLGPINRVLCKSTADNAAGALATDTSDFKIQYATAGGSEGDAGFTTQPAIYARESTSNNEFFFADWVNNAWFADLETGRVIMYKAKLNGALADTDASATIDNVTCFGGGTAPSPTSATNTYDLAGSDNDDCLIVKDGTGYVLIQILHHAC